MKAVNILLVLLVILAGSYASPAFGAAKTVVLEVEPQSMYCSMCAITLKKSLTRVPGVSKVSVNYEKKEATVTYDDEKVATEALTKATGNAGYPSKVKGEVGQ